MSSSRPNIPIREMNTNHICFQIKKMQIVSRHSMKHRLLRLTYLWQIGKGYSDY